MSAQELREKLTEQLCTYGQDDIEVVQTPNSETTVSTVVPTFEITFTEARQRIALLQKFVKELMVPGQDYGMIPRCDKPTLFKPGAEKLCDIYGFSKKVDVISKTEDWKEGVFSYTVKATLVSKRTGLIEAEGIGCCNSKEKKYSSQDPFSVSNTILKMSKKRALIDAVLSATRSSGLFSQDLEDIEDNEKASANLSSQQKQPTINTPIGSNFDVRSVTQSQLNKIQSLVSNRAIPVNKVKEDMAKRYSVTESRGLTLKQADDFIKYLISGRAG